MSNKFFIVFVAFAAVVLAILAIPVAISQMPDPVQTEVAQIGVGVSLAEAGQERYWMHHESQGPNDPEPTWTKCMPESAWNGHDGHVGDWKGDRCDITPEPATEVPPTETPLPTIAASNTPEPTPTQFVPPTATNTAVVIPTNTPASTATTAATATSTLNPSATPTTAATATTGVTPTATATATTVSPTATATIASATATATSGTGTTPTATQIASATDQPGATATAGTGSTATLVAHVLTVQRPDVDCNGWSVRASVTPLGAEITYDPAAKGDWPDNSLVTIKVVATWPDGTQRIRNITVRMPADCEPDVVDICPNLQGPQAVVPEGLVIDDQGNCQPDGSGGGGEDELTPLAPEKPAECPKCTQQQQCCCCCQAPIVNVTVNPPDVNVTVTTPDNSAELAALDLKISDLNSKIDSLNAQLALANASVDNNDRLYNTVVWGIFALGVIIALGFLGVAIVIAITLPRLVRHTAESPETE